MDLGHAHLYLNHFPIIGSIIFCIFIIFSIIKKREDFLRISLWIFVCLAIIIIPVYLTGEPAEETVLIGAGIGEEIIEPHESAALVTLIIMEVLGVSSFILLLAFRKGKKIPSWISYSIAAITILFIVSAGITANLGGQIRHTELKTVKTPL
jgi:uncharacterized membrane protein